MFFYGESGASPRSFLSGGIKNFMISELKALFDYYEKEKGIDRGKMVEALSQALLAASKKSIGPARELRYNSRSHGWQPLWRRYQVSSIESWWNRR